MRYLLACLVALAWLSAVNAQTAEPDGTLLSTTLGLPQSFMSLPVFTKSTWPQVVTAGIARQPSLPQTTTKKTAPSSQTSKPAAKPVAKPAAKPATQTTTRKPTTSTAIRSGPSYMLKSTAYNSHSSQTDRTPHITATGARTRFGIIALSRDMLRRIPYGSLVRIEDLGSWGSGRGRGTYNRMLSGIVFQVEDTMHPRKVRTVDVWFYSRAEALRWGARQIKLTVLRFGRR